MGGAREVRRENLCNNAVNTRRGYHVIFGSNPDQFVNKARMLVSKISIGPSLRKQSESEQNKKLNKYTDRRA